MANPLAGLIGQAPASAQWKLRDGTVTSTAVLTVLVDGDTVAVSPTKSALTEAVAVGQRVMLLFTDRQLILLAAYAPSPLLDGSVHLDSLKTTGIRHQDLNTNASTSRGYPVDKAGLLEVTDAPVPGTTRFVYQRYTAYDGTGVYSRVYFGFTDSWSPWLSLHT